MYLIYAGIILLSFCVLPETAIAQSADKVEKTVEKRQEKLEKADEKKEARIEAEMEKKRKAH